MSPLKKNCIGRFWTIVASYAFFTLIVHAQGSFPGSKRPVLGEQPSSAALPSDKNGPIPRNVDPQAGLGRGLPTGEDAAAEPIFIEVKDKDGKVIGYQTINPKTGIPEGKVVTQVPQPPHGDASLKNSKKTKEKKKTK